MIAAPDPITDPFAPPESPIGPASVATADDFFEVFWRWEKYRLIYNGLLLAETALAVGLGLRYIVQPDALLSVFCYAIVANVCFCAGPVLHGYAWRLGARSAGFGLLIFIPGTLLAMVAAAVALITLMTPGNPFLK